MGTARGGATHIIRMVTEHSQAGDSAETTITIAQVIRIVRMLVTMVEIVIPSQQTTGSI